MPDFPLPASPADLIRFGFDEASAEAAAQEIAELVHAVFGPFDPEAAEGWALSAKEDLSPAFMQRIFSEAAEADDPLSLLASEQDALDMLERYIHPRWSSPRGRVLGHPSGLPGQTWSSLSETAREEVREALRHLRDGWATHVHPGRPKRDDFDTFLRDLADIYVAHTGHAEDRAVRAGRPLRRHTDVPHSPKSRFVLLAELVLKGLPPLPSGGHRIVIGQRTARGLSDRWESIKRHEAKGWKRLDEPDEGDPPT